MRIQTGDWVMYKQARRYLIGEVGGRWHGLKDVWNVGGCPVHVKDVLKVRSPQEKP